MAGFDPMYTKEIQNLLNDKTLMGFSEVVKYIKKRIVPNAEMAARTNWESVKLRHEGHVTPDDFMEFYHEFQSKAKFVSDITVGEARRNFLGALTPALRKICLEAEQKYSEHHPTVRVKGITRPHPEILKATVKQITEELLIRVAIRENGECIVVLKGREAL